MCHRLGIKMPSKISAFFYWSFMKSQEKNQCKNQTLCHSKGIEVPSNISCSFFTEASWNVKNKFNVETKRCITVLAYAGKCYKRFVPFFCWSFMKSEELNKYKNKKLCHSLGIEMSLKISPDFFLKLHEKSRTKSM